MSSFRSSVLQAVLAIFLATVASEAGAMTVRPGKPETPHRLLQVQRDVGPAGAAAAASAATGGRVLGVTTSRSGGRTVYRVKVLLPGGRMRTVIVDGSSGQVQG